ncbi:tyrosine-type recombinase/integrase [Mesorhizobium delmotii]|uniref:tyrosine-type recombinase/integrase n=1 Tax=Mesorhizobium delmotii TaxID=1631247 RepID=UPI001FCEAC9B|nr:tyrosine-type recombinase/integrase [Mesorhizobium delmotii]
MKRADRPLIGFLTRPEIQAILDSPDDATWAGRRDRVLFSLMYNTGARVSEIIGIRCRDIVLEGQPAVHLHGKGRKERCVPLWRPTPALIRRWQRSLETDAQDGFLLPNRGREDDPLQRHATVGSRRRRSGATSSLSRWPLDLTPCDPEHDSKASALVRCRHHRHRTLVGA